MNKFLKNILSSCLGSLLAITIIILTTAIIITSYTSKSKPNQKGILHINVNGAVSDFQSGEFNFADLNFNEKKLHLWDLRNKIFAASTDDKIKAIFLEFDNAQISQELTMEIAQYLTDFRKNGKKVFSYSYYYNQNAYLLSSYGDRVILNPNGSIDLKGYAIYSPFFSSLLEKLNIDINIYYAGKYKSSTEPYRLNEFSEENKFQTRIYLNQLKETLLNSIYETRAIDKDILNEILDGSNYYDAEMLKKVNIIDDVMYLDEFKQLLKDEFETNEFVSFSDYEIPKSKIKHPKNAIVFAEGEIIWDGSGVGVSNGKLAKTFKKIKEDEDIETVVLRINSPGGNGYASDLIYHEIQALRKDGKKVYASLGEYAASGGYYIASACDSIFASENTLTGSIGVYLMLPTIDRFLENELLVSVDSIKSNKNAIGYSPLMSIDANEEKKLIYQTEKLYQLFLERVSEGRGISKDSIHELAQGRIWTGKDALGNGLVDDLKSLDEVLEMLNSRSTGIRVYPEENASVLDQLMENGVGNFAASSKNEIKFINSHMIEFNNLLKKPEPMMRLIKGSFVTIQ
ncbi:signal peptide peptidase SppA [Portibacter lacus]|uniref:Signal peptide peptidase SppA n=1 Tax=Portibacter lacus TaxID=1099794 RepID=A0AA37ST58_9BACT|nr:signal peptide peptidase SppA [Portibacter lacus]GLR19687.1 signal peptide peptidase SppA [Portibacter lacus]